jgi:hypothetical protein
MRLRCLTAATLLLACAAAQAQPGYYDRNFPPPPSGWAHSEARACDFYAREQAYRYAPPGAGMRGAVRGAVGGAGFGAIVGGGRGAKRGAAAGAALGAIAAGARAQRERDYAYGYAFDDCMRGFRR